MYEDDVETLMMHVDGSARGDIHDLLVALDGARFGDRRLTTRSCATCLCPG